MRHKKQRQAGGGALRWLQIEFFINRAKGVLLATFGAELTTDVLASLTSDLVVIAAREGFLDTIIDFSPVTAIMVDSAALIRRARNAPIMTGKARVLVGPSDPLFGLLRLFGSHREASGGDQSLPTIVRTLPEAFAVLKLVDPVFEPLASPKLP